LEENREVTSLSINSITDFQFVAKSLIKDSILALSALISDALLIDA